MEPKLSEIYEFIDKHYITEKNEHDIRAYLSIKIDEFKANNINFGSKICQIELNVLNNQIWLISYIFRNR